MKAQILEYHVVLSSRHPFSRQLYASAALCHLDGAITNRKPLFLGHLNRLLDR